MSPFQPRPHTPRIVSREEAAETTVLDTVAVITVLSLVVALIAVLGSI